MHTKRYRDYTVHSPIRLFIFQDRLGIHSHGKLPNAVDVEAMRLGTHNPRNPILMSHLAKLGYMTSLGSGVPRIIRLVTERVGREPDILARDFEVMVIIPRLQQ